ncbi:signal transduction histidine kinase [Rhodothalassium salexigens DSM 2132]|uniref:histidine kinase n=1 Tax=Rhodothalassium salexigens DSM 2132 TaxID=1188247 RepID=A0A4R2PW43_RHOSA|nr:hypothetical protein [Rhodothalassium salexigens DSM 2132]TCP38371.1 signal transduction histidine kinase [Rhodothalassium salexigens DSM 2132]
MALPEDRRRVSADMEARRLQVMRHYQIIDTGMEAEFERIVRLARSALGFSVAALSILDGERQWFKARIGLDMCETDRMVSFCTHTIEQSKPLVVPDATADTRFCTSPLVVGEPYIRFYAGAPLIVPEGAAIGTLFVVDHQPRSPLDARQLAVLEDLAGLTVSALVDRRDRLKREAELEARVAEAEEAARRSAEAKQEFLALAGHELRTPLNAIMGFAHLISNHDAPLSSDQVRDYAQSIGDGGGRLLKTIEKLLGFVQCEQGDLKLENEIVAVAPLLGQAVRQMTPEAEAGDVRLEVAPAAADLTVLADRVLLFQMLEQMLSNAIRFSPRGGLVRVSAARHADGAMALVVEDEGEGMDETALRRAMKAFGQAHSGLTRPHEGIGLGLPLTKRLAELHGGSVSLTPISGAGVRAELTLPSTRVDPETVRLNA